MRTFSQSEEKTDIGIILKITLWLVYEKMDTIYI